MALLGTVALGLAVSHTTVNAQQRPDLSGTWMMDATRSESLAQAADASPREPVRLVITQSPSSVRVQRTFDGQTQTIDYPFDVSGAPLPVGTSGPKDATPESGGDSPVPVDKAVARWIDGKLSTTTVYRVNGMATTKMETYELSANGREMVVLNELKMEHGYESNDGKGPQGYTSAKDVYSRVAAR